MGTSPSHVDFRPKVLVADDDRTLADAVTKWLRREGYAARAVYTGCSALDLLQTESFDLVLLDLDLPDKTGWEVLELFRTESIAPIFVVLTGSTWVDDAVRAVRLGAADFVSKPTRMPELQEKLERALASPTLRRSLGRPSTGTATIAQDPAMQGVLAMARKAAQSPRTSVLLLGESGVGKEVVASTIHHASARRTGPFVRVNLSAISPSVIEGELFGSTRGAFTGSANDRPGLLRSADGGTLLLDELCEFDINLQAKLLRVLETRRFFPVGSDQEVEVDVRILAATNQDPEVAIEAGRMREDLYYRVSTVSIHIPPLRDRPDDILPLAEHFLAVFSAEVQRHDLEFSTHAEAAMLAHGWPGNVRQLRNAVERAVVLSPDSTISPESLGLGSEYGDSETKETVPTPRSLSLEETRQQAVESIEKAHIQKVMKIARGSPTRAASMLKISRSTLWAKLKRYDLSP